MNILEEIGITEEELEIVEQWCEEAERQFNEDPYFSTDVGFEDEYGTFIHNIFYEGTGRFELDIEDAVEEYGIDNIRDFCQQVLERS